MSDRIAVMKDGIVEQVAGPEDVYERPATAFVASFIGVSNLLPGEIASATEVRLDSGAVVAAEHDLAPGERCHAVVRPEKLVVGGDGPGIEGLLESSVYLGTATQLTVRFPDETALTALVPNVDEAARRNLPAPGEQVRLSWQPEHMHIVREESS